jgi:hypothetical protein
MQTGINDFNRKVGEVGVDKACATTEMDMGQTETLTSVGPPAPATAAAVAPVSTPVTYADGTKTDLCFFSAQGRVVIDGRCAFDSYPGGKGSFEVDSLDGATFAVVNVNSDGTADASWDDGAGSHAQTLLGTMTRVGGCWSNSANKICVWKPGPRPNHF